MYKDSIEFSLSSADKEVVGFILAQELAILTYVIWLLKFPYYLYLNPIIWLEVLD